MEWLHQGCDGDLSADLFNFGSSNFPFKNPFEKCLNRLFIALASRSGFGAAISDTVVRNSIVVCNSVSADRIVMAASRLLRAATACVIDYSLLQLDIVNRIGVAASRLRYWFVSRMSVLGSSLFKLCSTKQHGKFFVQTL